MAMGGEASRVFFWKFMFELFVVTRGRPHGCEALHMDTFINLLCLKKEHVGRSYGVSIGRNKFSFHRLSSPNHS